MDLIMISIGGRVHWRGGGGVKLFMCVGNKRARYFFDLAIFNISIRLEGKQEHHHLQIAHMLARMRIGN